MGVFQALVNENTFQNLMYFVQSFLYEVKYVQITNSCSNINIVITLQLSVMSDYFLSDDMKLRYFHYNLWIICFSTKKLQKSSVVYVNVLPQAFAMTANDVTSITLYKHKFFHPI